MKIGKRIGASVIALALAVTMSVPAFAATPGTASNAVISGIRSTDAIFYSTDGAKWIPIISDNATLDFSALVEGSEVNVWLSTTNTGKYSKVAKSGYTVLAPDYVFPKRDKAPTPAAGAIKAYVSGDGTTFTLGASTAALDVKIGNSQWVSIAKDAVSAAIPFDPKGVSVIYRYTTASVTTGSASKTATFTVPALAAAPSATFDLANSIIKGNAPTATASYEYAFVQRTSTAAALTPTELPNITWTPFPAASVILSGNAINLATGANNVTATTTANTNLAVLYRKKATGTASASQVKVIPGVGLLTTSAPIENTNFLITDEGLLKTTGTSVSLEYRIETTSSALTTTKAWTLVPTTGFSLVTDAKKASDSTTINLYVRYAPSKVSGKVTTPASIETAAIKLGVYTDITKTPFTPANLKVDYEKERINVGAWSGQGKTIEYRTVTPAAAGAAAQYSGWTTMSGNTATDTTLAVTPSATKKTYEFRVKSSRTGNVLAFASASKSVDVAAKPAAPAATAVKVDYTKGDYGQIIGAKDMIFRLATTTFAATENVSITSGASTNTMFNQGATTLYVSKKAIATAFASNELELKLTAPGAGPSVTATSDGATTVKLTTTADMQYLNGTTWTNCVAGTTSVTVSDRTKPVFVRNKGTATAPPSLWTSVTAQ